MNDPADIALADQFIAASHEAVALTVQAMKEMLAAHPPNVEVQLTQVAAALTQLCEEDPENITKIATNYVTAIYELAKND